MRIGRGASRTARWLLAAVMAFGASVAMAQITGTKHNLGTTGPGPNKMTGAGTAEICVFCHTPHAADVSTPGLPLWNKALPASGAGYTIYSSSTMDGLRAVDGVAGGVSIGSVSLACLSCHDGTQAMDNVLNAPGSGGLDATGGGTDGRTGAAWAWVASARVTAEGKMLNSGDSLSMLSQDLSNDHPIGMQYCGGGYTTAGAGTTVGAGDCVDRDFFAPTSAVIGSQRVFWVDSGTAAGSRDKGDMILYNRDFGGTNPGPSVECASCHDPHNGTNGTFLRKANTGSAVCLACHNK